MPDTKYYFDDIDWPNKQEEMLWNVIMYCRSEERQKKVPVH